MQINSPTKIQYTTVRNMETIVVNRGTGAGGANTNANGLSFEKKTNNETGF